MDNPIRHDLKINGSGSSSGGYFDKVGINGDGRIDGDVDSNKITTNGSSRIEGSVRTKQLKVNGTSSIYGHLHAEKMVVHGESDISGSLSAREIQIFGTANVDQNVNAEFVKGYGAINVGGNCEIENFTTKGGFTIGGLLNVGTMDLKISWHSRAKEIGGERIIVRRSSGIDMAFKSLLRMFKAIPDAMLITDSIEGDDISLEYTRANVVRGNNISVGPGCEIDHVEYHGTYYQAEDARVNSCIQV